MNQLKIGDLLRVKQEITGFTLNYLEYLSSKEDGLKFKIKSNQFVLVLNYYKISEESDNRYQLKFLWENKILFWEQINSFRENFLERAY